MARLDEETKPADRRGEEEGRDVEEEKKQPRRTQDEIERVTARRGLDGR